ncbi:MAG: histidine kinase [Sandaracinus sp.]|nr:histidine kinase [Sandaracinus sp.]
MDDPGWETRDSGSVPLPPSRRRERVSEVSTGELRRSEVQAKVDAVLRPPVARVADLAHVCLDLGRELAPDADEEHVLDASLAAFARILPGRRLVARILDPETKALDLVRSTGRLLEGRSERVALTRAAVGAAGLTLEDAEQAGIQVVPTYDPDFAEGAPGADAALVSDGLLFGTLGFEYHPDAAPPADDEDVVGLLAAQLAGALARARARQEASYLSGYLGRLLDHANVPIAVLDRRRRVQVVSEALLELLGRDRGELLGRDLARFVAEPERGKLLPALLGALRGQPLESFEIGLSKADGTMVRLSTNLVSVLGPQGDVEGVIAIGHDLTQLRALESQIVQAEKLATLGQLAAGVVHELNNPLTSISVYGEYLLKKGERDGADDGDVEKLRRIVQSAERILRFTRDLVTYARPASEHPQRLSLQEVLDQAVVFCEHVIGEAAANVEKVYAEEVPPIHGVRGQLHQVFINLITNACHAMPHGAGKLRIALDGGDDGVEVRLRDNGSGIPAEQVEAIFEPFFSTKGEGKGTGLGLSIVKKIVQQHGGEIEVSSFVGDGTTFRVWLPRSPEG